MKKTWNHFITDSIREIVFGLEDSLVSTLGVVVGVAAGAQSTFIVILSGLVLVAVEGTSMAAGSYLSSKSAIAAKKADGGLRGESHENPLRAAFVMGLFYFIGGFVPLTPFLFLKIQDAYIPSITATAVVLFLIGVWSSKYTKRSPWKSGAEMLFISLGAALLGYLIGHFVGLYFEI